VDHRADHLHGAAYCRRSGQGGSAGFLIALLYRQRPSAPRRNRLARGWQIINLGAYLAAPTFLDRGRGKGPSCWAHGGRQGDVVMKRLTGFGLRAALAAAGPWRWLRPAADADGPIRALLTGRPVDRGLYRAKNQQRALPGSTSRVTASPSARPSSAILLFRAAEPYQGTGL